MERAYLWVGRCCGRRSGTGSCWAWEPGRAEDTSGRSSRLGERDSEFTVRDGGHARDAPTLPREALVPSTDPVKQSLLG